MKAQSRLRRTSLVLRKMSLRSSHHDIGYLLFVVRPLMAIVAGLLIVGYVLIWAGVTVDSGIIWIFVGMAMLVMGIWILKRVWYTAREQDRMRARNASGATGAATFSAIFIIAVAVYVIFPPSSFLRQIMFAAVFITIIAALTYWIIKRKRQQTMKSAEGKIR